MGVSSRGLWEHSRSSRHHKGTLSFFFQLGKNCCESHVLSSRRTGPSTSRTVQAQHRRDSCCQQKRRQQRSLGPPATLLLLRLCTKVTVPAHAPSDAALHLHSDIRLWQFDLSCFRLHCSEELCCQLRSSDASQASSSSRGPALGWGGGHLHLRLGCYQVSPPSASLWKPTGGHVALWGVLCKCTADSDMTLYKRTKTNEYFYVKMLIFTIK